MIRLIITPATIGQFDAHLEDGTFVCRTHQPSVDGARALLKLGYAPAELLTTRMAGSEWDSWMPLPIEEWAKWTYTEGDKGLRRERWRPGPYSRLPVRGDIRE